MHLDQYKLESTAHILSGCKEIKNNYSKRHDYMVEKIASELKPHCNDIYINKTVRSTFPDTTVESRVLDLKPDILMKYDEGVNIMDIGCPYDLYIEATYKTKIEKYQCIKEYLNHQGIDCVVSAIVIGSLGTIHSQALKVLMNLKMNKRVAKGLLKWCSTGNMMWPKWLRNLLCKSNKEG